MSGLRRTATILFALAACGGPSRPGAINNLAFDGGPGVDTFSRPEAIPVPDRMPSCGGTAVSLTRRDAEVLFVVDRSGSMVETTLGGRSKWNSLLETFRNVLPALQTDLTMGLLVFPKVLRPSPTGDPLPPSEVCDVLRTLDVEPGRSTAAAIMAQLGRALPAGATPTNTALEAAADYYRRTPDRVGARYLVLATDGGPNCNGALENATCRCSAQPEATLCRSMSNIYARHNCLDDARTVATVASLRAMGIETFVLGLPGTETLVDVLDRMAEAGGRARATSPRYLAATSYPDLVREFQNLTSGLIECRFRLTMAPPDPTLVDVRLGGQSLIHDTGRRDGWDWSDDTHEEILFFGQTCDTLRASSGGTRLVAAFGCPAPTPP
ncbi:MAG: VWA domain-containing protein [Deltaproteobacteria bacterium]|nr:VWA domain-containing protein [Deltaproteobacteria bacterium]